MHSFEWMALLAFVQVCLMILCMIAGRRMGNRQRMRDPQGSKAGVAAVEGAVFSLLALFIAFTFSGAASRYDGRRALIVQETNAIGTAYLRLDLLSPAAQPALREEFRRYVDARIAFYNNLTADLAASKQTIERYTALQRDIWTQAVAACRTQDSVAVTTLVISALNEMIDITTTRMGAAETHPPTIIYAGLVLLMLAGSLLAGFGMAEAKRPSRLHLIVFPLILATAVYVIADIEFPRTGLVRIDRADHFLIDLRASMN